ncbi:glycosyl hydrolase family 18 protein [Algivirga pacifica]|uniref:chitinase n=1 Tax=Algivirga pacifica TaxID=1162670 RepID=A0ABP9DFB7_9BACT
MKMNNYNPGGIVLMAITSFLLLVNITIVHAANCDGVPNYAPYPEIYMSGDRVVHEGILYESLADNLYNVTPGTADHWWKPLGTCDGGSTDTPPTVSFTAPTNTIFTQETFASISISIAVSDDNSVASSSITVDGITTSGTSATFTPSAYGDYVVTASATDDAGQSTTATLTITVLEPDVVVDNPPTVSFTAPTNTTITQDTFAPISISIQVSDDNIVASSSITVDGATTSGTSASFTPSAYGDYVVTASATDDAQQSSTATLTITVKEPTVVSPPSDEFLIVGYLPDYRLGAVNSIDFSKLTHVVFFSLQPNTSDLTTYAPLSAGALSGLQNLVTKAHAAGAKVTIALGGWGKSQGFSQIAADPALRVAFTSSVMDFVTQYDLDGVDLDWEYPASNEGANFKALMQGFADALQPQGKILTMAVAAYGSNAAGKAVAADVVDYIHLMTYDGGDHGTMAQAQQSIDFWTGYAPASKLVLGVPFYGRNSGNSAATYADLLAQGASPDANTHNGYYYNGRPMMVDKVNLAAERGTSGIMIWELGQDAFDDRSLLTTIYDAAAQLQPACESNCPPQVSINSPSGTIQADLPYTLTIDATASDPDGTVNAITYAVNGNTISGNSYIVNTYGQYAITVTATDNDGNTSVAESTITIEEVPLCDLEAWDPSVAYQGGHEVSYEGRVYRAKWWTRGDIPSSSEEWADMGACGSARFAQSFTAESISVYPNPFQTSLTIQLSGLEEGIVSLVALNGKTIFTSKIKGQVQIDTNTLQKGLYILQVKTNTSSVMKKIIKQ